MSEDTGLDRVHVIVDGASRYGAIIRDEADHMTKYLDAAGIQWTISKAAPGDNLEKEPNMKGSEDHNEDITLPGLGAVFGEGEGEGEAEDQGHGVCLCAVCRIELEADADGSPLEACPMCEAEREGKLCKHPLSRLAAFQAFEAHVLADPLGRYNAAGVACGVHRSTLRLMRIQAKEAADMRPSVRKLTHHRSLRVWEMIATAANNATDDLLVEARTLCHDANRPDPRTLLALSERIERRADMAEAAVTPTDQAGSDVPRPLSEAMAPLFDHLDRLVEGKG